MRSSKRSRQEAPSSPVTAPDRTLLWLFLALLAVTLLAYLPAWHGGPLWDDDAHLTRVDLQSATGLWRIWFELGATQQYYPVAHSAFWVMHALWGDATLGYHLVNIALHATSAWLLAVILRRLNVPGAMLAAMIFAVHPVHVESVAWMTELKNTLSGLFYLVAAYVYLRFDEDRRRSDYLLAFGLFVLALLTKSVTASLPAALLIVFWWQRGRLRWREDAQPLVPFFAIGIGAGLFTSWVERTQIGAEGVAFQISMLERLVIAGRAVWFYAAKLVWPTDLLFVYPRWTPSAAPVLFLFPLAALLVVGVCWWLRTRTRGPLALVLFFGGTLFPALGFVNVYPFVYSFVADHFQYLASIGLIVGASVLVTRLAQRVSQAPEAAMACALIIGVPLTGLTYLQSQQYADAETLYRTTLAKNPNAWMAHINLGWVYLKEQRFELAITETREALRLKPDLPQAQNNLGTSLLGLNRFDEAIVAYREALRLKPSDQEVKSNLGLALQRAGDAQQDRGQIAEAVATYLESLQVSATNAETHHNLGSAYARLGKWDDAIGHYEETLRLNPTSARAIRNLSRAHNSRGIEFAEAGKMAEARADFSAAVQLDPDFMDARVNLSRASK